MFFMETEFCLFEIYVVLITGGKEPEIMLYLEFEWRRCLEGLSEICANILELSLMLYWIVS